MTASHSPGRAVATSAARPRSSVLRRVMAACLLFIFLGFIALGTWQVRRLFWKLDLIERVDRRVHAPAVAAPGPAEWPTVAVDASEYQHVRLSGTFLYEKTARVQALTRLGGGVWLLTPLRSADGTVTLINRGFIATGASDAGEGAAGGQTQQTHRQTEVTGLLRISEPGGGFLRHNDAAADRWFSRDVQAIAASRGLGKVAPYFVDADAASGAADLSVPEPQRAARGQPVGGLTVISFPNNHLVYAFTWFVLALMTAGAGYWVTRDEKRRRAARPEQESNDGKQG